MPRIGFNTSLLPEEHAAVKLLFQRNPDEFKYHADVLRRGLIEQVTRELGKGWRKDPEIVAIVADTLRNRPTATR